MTLAAKLDLLVAKLDTSIETYLDQEGSVPSQVLQMRSDLATLLADLPSTSHGSSTAANQLVAIERLTEIVNLLSAKTLKPSIHFLPLPLVDKEYSLTLSNIKKLSFQVLTGGDIRYSYKPGAVASGALPFYPLKKNIEEVEDFAHYNATFTGTIYFATNTAKTTVALKTWEVVIEIPQV